MPQRERRRLPLAGGVAALLVAIVLSGCSRQLIVDPGPMARLPQMLGGHVVTRDGLALPLRHWPAKGPTTAVILALHGFNDYGAFIKDAAAYFAERGIDVYAYDQRGFGAAPFVGRWFETERFLTDARDVTRMIGGRHPGVPLYLLGESMGGAVVMSMLAETPMETEVAGAILSAPAVWGRETMPWYQTSLLWVAANIAPGLHLTGRGLKIQPSDNIEMLRELGRDPLVIKGANVAAIHGLVDLMDLALTSARRFRSPALILYGAKDEIVQAAPTRVMMARLPEDTSEQRRVAVYDAGYHMLLRDLQAETVWQDIVSWIESPAARLPSGADTVSGAFFNGL